MKVKESRMTAANWAKIVSDDFMRPVMTGVYFDLLNDCMVGTNSYILVECPIETEFDENEKICAFKYQMDLKKTWSKIVPLEFFNKAKYMGDHKKYSMEIYYDFSDEKFARVFHGPTQVFQCHYIDGTFPNYKAVTPKDIGITAKEIGVDLKAVNMLMKAIPYRRKALVFSVLEKMKGITFYHIDEPNFKGIIMPAHF